MRDSFVFRFFVIFSVPLLVLLAETDGDEGSKLNVGEVRDDVTRIILGWAIRLTRFLPIPLSLISWLEQQMFLLVLIPVVETVVLAVFLSIYV